ncbi:CopG family transcriptional regulator [Sphingomonas immobilis]|uniref:CopG family transcriptional regulator n=1 Tax=Sphingomonas immobilis TaxID=3063997 RepID=A0ABT9A140_9SPHN|nr:CopG family transcriptional regulator [Sphingomonas sp. CA1-15]MDO7843548.1 CopG family transcriptional regulator [Sphingomonas sp. CA1-15]
MKVRQNLYIDREIADALEAIAAGPGGNKSRLVNDALAAWLARRGTRELDDTFKVRLDRMSRDLDHIRRDTDVIIESLALFVRYQLLVTAPLPEADSVALAVGLDRFEKFVGQVGRQLATGRRTLGPAKPGKTS